MDRYSRPSIVRVCTSGLLAVALCGSSLLPVRAAGYGSGTGTGSTSGSTTSSGGGKCGGKKGNQGDSQVERDLRVVEEALSVTLDADQKSAITKAVEIREASIKSASDTFKSTVKAIFADTSTTADAKKTAVGTASATFSSALTDAKVNYRKAVADTVDMDYETVNEKLDAYLAGQGKGPKGKGGKGGQGKGGPGKGGNCGGGSGTTGGTNGGTSGGTTGGTTDNTGY